MTTFRDATNALVAQRAVRLAVGVVFAALRRSLERRERALRIRGLLCGHSSDNDRQSETVPVEHIRRRETWRTHTTTSAQPVSIPRAKLASTA